MAKYLIKGSYSPQGVAGVVKSGGSERVKAVTSLVEGVGGSLESMYFAFGDCDFYVIAEVPDNNAAAAIAAAVGASGSISDYQTVVLLTAEDVDAATQMTTSYRPPGS